VTAGESPGGGVLDDLLASVNRLRFRSSSEGEQARREEREVELDERFGCSRRLAVYGSLVPGRTNHYMLSDLTGEWALGMVRGALRDVGWGAVQGYPALCWDPRSEQDVAVHLFVSPELPRRWGRLDAFEGEGYLRILVTLELAGWGGEVANLYAVRGLGG